MRPVDQVGGMADDVELVHAVVRGSQEALAVLYDRHAPALFRAALRLQADHGIAEEVVQEAFLALWDRGEQFDASLGTVAGWLTAIVRNRTIDRLRAQGRRIQSSPFSVVAAGQPDEASTIDWLLASGGPVATGAAEPLPDDVIAAHEAHAAVTAALVRLSAEERVVVVLAYRDGLSQSEIAERLGWPLGTVKTRSRRALRRLREVLEAAPAEPGGTPGVRLPRTADARARGATPAPAAGV